MTHKHATGIMVQGELDDAPRDRARIVEPFGSVGAIHLFVEYGPSGWPECGAKRPTDEIEAFAE
jgi:hypothetical protein